MNADIPDRCRRCSDIHIDSVAAMCCKTGMLIEEGRVPEECPRKNEELKEDDGYEEGQAF